MNQDHQVPQIQAQSLNGTQLGKNLILEIKIRLIKSVTKYCGSSHLICEKSE